MTYLQRELLKTLIEESGEDFSVGIKREQYIKVLCNHQGNYGEIDLALAMIFLQQLGYVENPGREVLGTVHLTKLGREALSSHALKLFPR